MKLGTLFSLRIWKLKKTKQKIFSFNKKFQQLKITWREYLNKGNHCVSLYIHV